jgi:hypothetical protein
VDNESIGFHDAYSIHPPDVSCIFFPIPNKTNCRSSNRIHFHDSDRVGFCDVGLLEIGGIDLLNADYIDFPDANRKGD